MLRWARLLLPAIAAARRKRREPAGANWTVVSAPHTWHRFFDSDPISPSGRFLAATRSNRRGQNRHVSSTRASELPRRPPLGLALLHVVLADGRVLGQLLVLEVPDVPRSRRSASRKGRLILDARRGRPLLLRRASGDDRGGASTRVLDAGADGLKGWSAVMIGKMA